MSFDAHPQLSIERLGKRYRPARGLWDRLCRRRPDGHWALRDVSFDVSKGRTIGIIGPNGSGKSTLLQIIAGTLAPTEGRVVVRGRVSALLELGSGFDPDFTGRENVFFNSRLLGLSRLETERRFDDIVRFAEIGDYLDRPLRTYSTGMAVRLAFSVAIHVDPDILLIDEALAVGDARFQQRCLSRIRKLRDRGVSILFVSHDLDAAKRLCDEIHVLDAGRLVRSGRPDHVVNAYLASMTGSHALETPAPPHADFRSLRHGDGNARIVQVDLLTPPGRSRRRVAMDSSCRLRFEIEFHKPVETPILGFYLRDRLGTDLIGVNTHQEGKPLPPAEPGDRLRVDFLLPMRLKPGHYSISPALAYNQDEMRYLDWIDHALVFEVVDTQPGRAVFGLIHPEVRVEVGPLHRFDDTHGRQETDLAVAGVHP